MATAAATSPEDAAAGSPDPALMFAFILMCLGMFLAVLDIQIVAASLGQIQAGLAASPDEVAWVQTSYLIAEVIMIPLCGFLSRALSLRWLFVLSCGGFTLASLACASVTTIEAMIVARAVQGFTGGAMIPTVYSATFLLFGRKRQGNVLIVITSLVTLAPAIGPAFGGWVTSFASWHWLFLINIVPGIFITLSVAILVKLDDRPDWDLLKRMDITGVIALALFCGGLVFVLEDGTRRQWFEDETIRVMSVVVLLSLLLLWWRIETAAEPIVSLKPFADVNFAASCALSVVFGIGLYGLLYLYPLYLTRVANLPSLSIGAIVSITGISISLSGLLAGWLQKRVDHRVMASFGYAIMALSTWMTSTITNDWRFDELLVPQILRGMGIMFGITSISIMGFATMPQHLIKDATGPFSLTRNLGGAVGIAIINSVIAGRTLFHQARLAESANPGRPEIADRIDMMSAMAVGRGYPDPEGFAVRAMAETLRREAVVMAIADSFVVLTWVFLAAALIPLFLSRPGSFADPPADGH